MTNKKSLKERAQEMSVRLPIMKDLDKGEMSDLLNKPVTIRDFDFMTGVIDKKTKAEKEPFAVFTIDEDPDHFYFGGMVITDLLQKLDNEGYHAEILADGLPCLFTEVKSKDGNKYVNVELYPGTPENK
jgi:hypothetical protein